MLRTRFAPSPTGYMHIGNLRTALYEYLIAKKENGTFILRIEDTDEKREVAGAVEVIMNTLNTAGISPDEGYGIGGQYGPYIQSERKGIYLEYAKKLVDMDKAYYCFCGKERLDTLKQNVKGGSVSKYDRHCLSLSKEAVADNLGGGVPYVIRQKMPTKGKTVFSDVVFGDIEVDNAELDDQIIIKSDGFPTYNFANVIDDHLMNITHVVRGDEYLSSTPKYNLLYEAYGWDVPVYIHVPPVMREKDNKLSKRNGDAGFEDLLSAGFLPEAVLNYILLLGWSPSDNREFFTLPEMIEAFDITGLSKSPAIFDERKLRFMNGEYIKNMDFDRFYGMTKQTFERFIKTENIPMNMVAKAVKTRLETLNDIDSFVDFIDELPKYMNSLFIHKKMKTNEENSLANLRLCLPILEELEDWSESSIHDAVFALIEKAGIKNGQMLWPIRCALSGKETSFAGGIELLFILGKDESLRRIRLAVDMLAV